MKKGQDKPLTAGVIAGSIRARDVKKAVAAGADILEIRVDTFSRRGPEDIARDLRTLKTSGRPLILTVRSIKEGGRYRISDGKRLELFVTLAPFVDYVDIELGSSAILKSVVDLCRRLGKKLIVSYHNFKKTPGAGVLAGIVKKSASLRPDVIKIACVANGAEDLRRLASLLVYHTGHTGHAGHKGHDGLTVIGMGRYGKASRVFFPAIGSCIAYASTAEASAPGQMSVAEMKKEFKRFCIGR